MAVQLAGKIMGMSVKPSTPIQVIEEVDNSICQECQDQTMVNAGGCHTCSQCGWSKCG